MGRIQRILSDIYIIVLTVAGANATGFLLKIGIFRHAPSYNEYLANYGGDASLGFLMSCRSTAVVCCFETAL